MTSLYSIEQYHILEFICTAKCDFVYHMGSYWSKLSISWYCI